VPGEPAGQQPELGAPRPGFLLSGLRGHQHGRSRGSKPAQEFYGREHPKLTAPGNLASRAGRVLAPSARSRRRPASVCVPSRLRPAFQLPLETLFDELPEPRGSQPEAQSPGLPHLQNGQVQQGASKRARSEVREEWGRFDKSVRRLIVDFFYNCRVVNEMPALPNAWQSLLAANPRIPALLGGHVSAAVCQAFLAHCTSLFAKLVN
jgi:hypothetical protein